jgi:hypothetical protein
MPAIGFRPARDETIRTWPPLPARWGSAARVRRKAAVRFVPRTLSHSSSACRPGWRRGPPRRCSPAPAGRRSARRRRRRPPRRRRGSAGRPRRRPPVLRPPRSRPPASRARPRPRDAVTRAPSRARARAIDRPIPRPAPVTRAEASRISMPRSIGPSTDRPAIPASRPRTFPGSDLVRRWRSRVVSRRDWRAWMDTRTTTRPWASRRRPPRRRSRPPSASSPASTTRT